MRRRMSGWSKLLVTFTVSTGGALALGVAVVHRYPWETMQSDFSGARGTRFSSPWPISPLEEERQERKKARRFAKSEQLRRANLQLRRMEVLNVPLFDLFLDPGVQLVGTADRTVPPVTAPFPWPRVDSGRSIGEPPLRRAIHYVALPTSHGSAFLEGVELNAGEELRFNFPVVKNRRSLTFTALPLSPGTLRGFLGQYSWVRNFSERDVHKPQMISIPINDATANQMRILSVSMNALLMAGSVSQWEKSGRMPIQVLAGSDLWKARPEMINFEAPSAQASGAQEGGSSAGANGAGGAPSAPEIEVNPLEGTAPAEGGSQVAFGGNGIPENTGNTGNTGANRTGAGATAFSGGSAGGGGATGDAGGSQGAALPDGQENSARPPQQGAQAAQKSEPIDPMEQRGNKQVVVSEGRTAALGYNVLLLQLESLPEEVLAQPSLLEKIAPRLAQLMADSLTLRESVEMPGTAIELFQKTVLGDVVEQTNLRDPVVAKAVLGDENQFNLYAKLRNFGYRVVTLAPAEFLGLSPRLGWGREFPAVEGRWLDGNDWAFAQRHKSLDDQAEPVSGLDAIFQTNDAPLAAALTGQDFERIGRYLATVSAHAGAFPDWRANEAILPDTRDLFVPRVVDAFQRWTKDNPQTRFFLHALLDNQVGASRPSIKELFKVFKLMKIGALSRPRDAERLARLALVDKALGQMLDTLTARKIEHRTLVAVQILPRSPRSVGASTAANAPKGSFLLKVPGVIASTPDVGQSVDLEDAVATLVTTMGVPLGANLPDSVATFAGRALEGAARVQAHPEERGSLARSGTDAEGAVGGGGTADGAPVFHRYSMFLRPGVKGCAPFEWHGRTEVIGLRASAPIFEWDVSGRPDRFKLFPCSLKEEVVEVSWFQRAAANASLEAESVSARDAVHRLGGHFYVDTKALATHLTPAGPGAAGQKGGLVELPAFLIGERALKLQSSTFSVRALTPGELEAAVDAQRPPWTLDDAAHVLELSAKHGSPTGGERASVLFLRRQAKAKP